MYQHCSARPAKRWQIWLAAVAVCTNCVISLGCWVPWCGETRVLVRRPGPRCVRLATIAQSEASPARLPVNGLGIRIDTTSTIFGRPHRANSTEQLSSCAARLSRPVRTQHERYACPSTLSMRLFVRGLVGTVEVGARGHHTMK